MSATIPESMRLDDLLKATGYDCPVDLQGKTFDQATEGGGGVVPTEWYLWADNESYLYYLPFETAPDTLDSLQAIYIGHSLITDIELSTREITDYLKYSDTAFNFTDKSLSPSERTFTRVTEDIPLEGAVEPNKEVTITKNGVKIIKPSLSKDFGYGSMAQVTVTVNVAGTAKLYVWKYIDEQTGNTFYLMTPTETLTENTKVFVNNNESGIGAATLLLLENSEEDTYYRFTENGIEFQTHGGEVFDLYTRSPSDDINLF